jgi:indole-3-glycerol phosphate synthase
MTILDEIAAYKRDFVAAARARHPLEDIRAEAADLPPTRGFAAALRGSRTPDGRREPQATLRLVAEIKRASPSKGVIREDFDPAALAQAYTRGGASAISVLTDEKYFQGSLDALRAVRAVTPLPLLRKEFMLDPYQVYEARVAGADAILLIAGLIPWPELRDLAALARRLTLDVLLEIHNGDELTAALELQPDVLGINNRDLRTREFETRLETTEGLLPRIPDSLTLISESGIRDRHDVERLAALGIDGILVGEHLMREADPGAAIASKLGIHRSRTAPRS